MATIKNYSNLTEWSGVDLHLVDIDIGPRGDVLHGYASIKGDRWNHGRLARAFAPFSTIIQAVEKAGIEPGFRDVDTGDDLIYVHNTEGFKVDDRVLIEDKNGFEINQIESIFDNANMTMVQDFVNDYKVNESFFISTMPEIKIAKNTDSTEGDFITGDFVEISDKDGDNSRVFEILDVDPDGVVEDSTTLLVRKLSKSYAINALVSVINTDSEWTKEDEVNPLINLQRLNWWDWAGQNVRSSSFIPAYDILEDSDGKILWKKHGLMITGDREDGDSQIGMMLSKNVDDIDTWTQFLGNANTQRPNPIIRHGYSTDRFNYEDADELNLLWNTAPAQLTITLDIVADGAEVITGDPDGSCCMEITYTGNGEVWGLLSTPMNMETITNDSHNFTFDFKGDIGNTVGSLYVDLLSADGTCQREDISIIDLQEATWDRYTTSITDYADFPGRKYIRAFIFGLTSAGSGTVLIDNVTPFIPMEFDEIIEDPTIIAGSETGNFAAYYTARERPRQILTSNALTEDTISYQVDVGDSSDFDVGDTIVIYDRNNYEMGEVDSVDSGTEITINHIGATSGDTDSEFQHDYATADQAMIANNTYRVNKIGGSYIITDPRADKSQWIKWSTNETSTPIFEPSATGSDWDSLSVKQPSVKIFGNKAYMFYTGQCDTNDPSIGIAVSTNFSTFTRLPENPYLEPTAAEFDSEGCFHPDFQINMPYTNLNYTGDDGTENAIGSAIFEYDFQATTERFHVTMLLFPLSCDGNPPEQGAVLFDMGNFRVEVTEQNTLTAHAFVEGTWIETSPDSENERHIDKAFGTTLAHDHWNLVVGQWNEGKLSITNSKMTPGRDGFADFFERSPWILTCDLEEGDTSVIIGKQAYGNWLDDVQDIEQDIMFWGKGYNNVDGRLQNEEFFQVNRIVSVTANPDETFTCELLNSIGPWGFSQVHRKFDFDGSDPSLGCDMGVLIAQGHVFDPSWNTNQRFYWNEHIRGTEPTNDINNIFFDSNVHFRTNSIGEIGRVEVEIPGETVVDSEGNVISSTPTKFKYEKSPGLDPSLARPPMIGNTYNIQGDPEKEKKRGWNLGYYGHIDLSDSVLRENRLPIWVPGSEHFDGHWEPSRYGGMIQLFALMINGSDSAFFNPKPKWYEFDLTGDGAEPGAFDIIARWILMDYDAGTDTYPDDEFSNYDLYLFGAHEDRAEGYLGRTFKLLNNYESSAETMLFTPDFEKRNSGSGQIEKSASGFDSVGVQSSNLFKFKDRYYNMFTGIGKTEYPILGTIIGDLYETSRPPADVSFEGTFLIPAGCCVFLDMNWKKKTDWVEMWSESGPSEPATMNCTFSKADGETEAGEDIDDFKYNLRWRLRLYSNVDDPTRDVAPIVKSWTVTFDETNAGLSDEFMNQQAGLTARKPVNKIVHWSSDPNLSGNAALCDLSHLEPIIRDLSYDIPFEPDLLGNLIASDVSIEIQNLDGYFSELKTASPFNNRIYLNDEMRIYSGFKTATALACDLDGEFEVAGRFLINHIELPTDGRAVIYCRSLLRTPMDTIVGKPIDGEPNNLEFADQKVKVIMESLLLEDKDSDGIVIGAGLDSENIFIEDVEDRDFSILSISNMTVGDSLQKLAQACGGIIYTDNQGDIFFKTFDNFSSGDFDFTLTTNTKSINYIGQKFDRLVKFANVLGATQVQGSCESRELSDLKLGRDIPISNDWIQKDEWADEIAENIINRYGASESEIRLESVYLPSVKILDTIEVTDDLRLGITGLSNKKYLVSAVTKNVSTFKEDYLLVSNFAIDS